MQCGTVLLKSSYASLFSIKPKAYRKVTFCWGPTLVHIEKIIKNFFLFNIKYNLVTDRDLDIFCKKMKLILLPSMHET